MGAWEGDEYVYGVDVNTGARSKWAIKLGKMFDWPGNQWNAGPNATPTVNGDLIFALSGNGDLVCVEKTGNEKWRKNMAADFGGKVNPIQAPPKAKDGWGWTWSPLVDGDRLICVPGGKQGLLAALDKSTGKPLWQSKEVPEPATYSSPILATVGGARMYVQLTNKGVYGFDPESGKKLWFYEKDGEYKDVVIPTPAMYKDSVFVTAWTAGSDFIKLSVNGKDVKVESAANDKMQEALDKLDNREGGVVIVDGFLFGYFEQPGLACIHLKSGDAVWANKNIKRGSLVYADGMLYFYDSENAEVLLIDASTKKPEKFSELVKGQFTLAQRSKLNKPSGRNWTHPVIANGKLYIRDQEFLYCYEIK
jgi:outer membrane protein assembly factor BamB